MLVAAVDTETEELKRGDVEALPYRKGSRALLLALLLPIIWKDLSTAGPHDNEDGMERPSANPKLTSCMKDAMGRRSTEKYRGQILIFIFAIAFGA